MYFARGSSFVLNTYRSTDECSYYAVSAHSLSDWYVLNQGQTSCSLVYS